MKTVESKNVEAREHLYDLISQTTDARDLELLSKAVANLEKVSQDTRRIDLDFDKVFDDKMVAITDAKHDKIKTVVGWALQIGLTALPLAVLHYQTKIGYGFEMDNVHSSQTFRSCKQALERLVYKK